MILGAEGASGTLENTWEFSVDKGNQTLIDQVGDATRTGKLVTLGYKEIVPNLATWKRDSPYLVTRVIQK
jgi:hypothetical protein